MGGKNRKRLDVEIIQWLDAHAGSVQAIATIVLVVVTIVYAWRTHAISKATAKQADASVKMAEEMAAQTLIQMTPRLLLRLKSGQSENGGARVEIQVCNASKSSAINVTVGLLFADLSQVSLRSKSYLSGEAEWETKMVLHRERVTICGLPVDIDGSAEPEEPVIGSEDDLIDFAKRKLQSTQDGDMYRLVTSCYDVMGNRFGSALPFYFEAAGSTDDDGTESGYYEARTQDLVFWHQRHDA